MWGEKKGQDLHTMLFCLVELCQYKSETGMSCIWKFTSFVVLVQCHVKEAWTHGSPVQLKEKYFSFLFIPCGFQVLLRLVVGSCGKCL